MRPNTICFVPKATFSFTAILIGLFALVLAAPETAAAKGGPRPPAPASLTFSPTKLSDGQYGSVYKSLTLKVTGGKAPYTFSSGNGLPPGMSLSTDGVLSGTPTAAGKFSFTVSAQDHTKAPGTLSGSQDYTLVIDQVPLTVTAGNAAMTYGGTVPPLTASYHGFINGDNASSLTTQPVVATTATSSSPAGIYSITASGAIDPNYTISYQTGTMTVSKAALTVTADNKSMPLGGPLPTLTISYTGFVNGNNASSLATQPTATTTATAASPAGSYPIIPRGGSSPNYTFSYVNGTLDVGKALLIITANPAGSVYGAPLMAGSSLTVNYRGFVNGDGPGGMIVPPIVTNTAVAGAPAGSYTLTPSGAVNPNYSIQYVNGTYTISPAVLNVTAVSLNMTYGSAVPALTASYSGFVNGDNASRLTTPPTITTKATSTSPAGAYSITASGAADPNYSFNYAPGTLSIGPAALLVAANAQTKEFGSPDPAFTYTTSGLLNGDNTGIITGSLSRTPGENVGTYPISKGSLSAGTNYTVSYTGNFLTITRASQHITWTQDLLVGCDSATQMHLTAAASSGLPVTYSISDPTIATLSGNVLTILHPGTAVVTATQTGNDNYTAAPAITDTLFYQPASLINQHWSDAIFFDNSSGDYVQWQWFKNGDAVPGATDPYYSESPSLNGQYYVIATNKSDQQIKSCTLTITAGATVPGGIKVYPNPAKTGAQVTVTINYPTASLQGAILQLVDINGSVRQQLTAVQLSMPMTLPSQPGIYIINLLLAGGQRVSTNVLVVE